MCFGSRFQGVQSVATGPVSGPIVKWIVITVRVCGGGICSCGKEEAEERVYGKRPGQDTVLSTCPQRHASFL